MFDKFIKENFILQNTNLDIDLSCSEVFAMLYFEVEEDVKKYIIDICYKICINNKKLYNIPCFYIIDFKNMNNKINIINTQHFIWISKMFYDYYKKYKDNKYLELAKDIINYIKHNNIRNNILINWLYINNNNKSCLSSIKYYAAIDVIYELDSDFFNTIYNTLKYHIKDDKIYQIYDINKKNVYNTDTPSDSHQNMELVEGLFNIYEINKDMKYYEKCIEIIKNIINSLVEDISVFSKLQVFFFIKKYNIKINNNIYIKLKNFVYNIIENYKKNKNIYVYTNQIKQDNIFGYIYLYRLIKNKYVKI